MSDPILPQGPETSPVDDSYWNALFEQEEFTSPPAQRQPTLDNQDAWSPLNRRLDGRFRWADGGADQGASWDLARRAYEQDEILELVVIGYNKGGLLVTWRGLPGFIPASHLTNFPHFHVPHERDQELARRQKQHIRVKIIELEPETNRLILSERAAQAAPGTRQQLLGQVTAGDRLTGRVTNLTDFGAFVDLGGVEGLIHISELSWRRILHPSDVVKPKEMVEVLVLSVDRNQTRIALSRKQLKPDPWPTVAERYQVGQLVAGMVSNIVNFGAFIRLEEELEGLVHVSELAEAPPDHPSHVVQKGDRVVARVLNVDGRKQRLSLSLRAASGG